MENKSEKGQKETFTKAKELLTKQGFVIESSDMNRPWGGFYVVKEDHAKEFILNFFPGLSWSDFSQFKKLSPKLLIVAPGKRLSWQYHHRRSEIWRVLDGEVGVVVSDTDELGPLNKLNEGDTISLKQGERHRLVGLEDWSILAEIWQHIDPNQPSDEDDIVRVQDDFGR